jgi:hypothetical protein
MGGGGGKPPGKSPAEEELQAEQLRGLKDQRQLIAEQYRMQNLLAPFMYKQAGLSPRMDAGQIVGFDEIPDELAPLRKGLERSYLERQQQALAGTLPVDPALERGLQENTQAQNLALREQLGPGFASSTPGIQAQAVSTQRGQELRSAARTGQMTLAQQLGMSQAQGNLQRQQSTMANMGGVFQAPAAMSGGSTNNLNAMAQVLQGYQNERQLAMGGMAPKKNRLGGTLSGAASGAISGAVLGSAIPVIGTGMGALFGGAAGGLMGYFS